MKMQAKQIVDAAQLLERIRRTNDRLDELLSECRAQSQAERPEWYGITDVLPELPVATQQKIAGAIEAIVAEQRDAIRADFLRQCEEREMHEECVDVASVP